MAHRCCGGRWPADRGFDEWYGIPRTYDECLWAEDPYYDAKRDGISRVLEGRKGQPVHELQQLTPEVRRNIDVEYMRRAKSFMKKSVAADKPFYLYFNHSVMHLPTVARAEFRGKTGHSEWADCLLELDSDFGSLLDYLKELGIENTRLSSFQATMGQKKLSRGGIPVTVVRILPVKKGRSELRL